MKSQKNLTLCAVCVVIVSSVTLAYNIDTKYPTIFTNSPDNYFGFAVALLKNREGPTALITAPRANSTVLRNQLYQPGVLFSCGISLSNTTTPCREVVLDKYGNTYTHAGGDLSYMDKKDDMWLGVSLDVQQNSAEGRVVTCGHLWKNQYYSQHYLTNGACYVINSDLDQKSVKKLVPFINKSKQTLNPPGIYYYAFGQVGTSAAFSEDGKNLLLGAPGFYDWTGTILSYLNPREENDYKDPVVPSPPWDQHISPESYIGYSITSGRFFDASEVFIAVGAPRDKNNYGRVYIVKSLRSATDKFSVHIKKEGMQFGEYFGASVMGVNLNNDRYTDLLVGAPFSSTESGGDEGKVYVFISNGLGLQVQVELFGKRKYNARFGTCIASIGDINQDGYNDIAIGAPYEDTNGAVYIYHGTATGLNAQYAQRVVSTQISSSLSGFGISISRGVDIDDNHYPDILIGSYASSQAALLRTYPIIQIHARLEFSPQQINTNITSCKLNGESVSCINVTMCLQYTGKHSLLTYEFEARLYVDSDRQNNILAPRGYFMENGKLSSVIYKKFNLEIGKEMCFSNEVYIRADTKDIITPMEFLLKYDLVKTNPSGTFCKTCPVIEPSTLKNVSKSISFQTGCGQDNQCLADLHVKAYILGNPRNLPLIIGLNKTLTINIEVSNAGEPAYLSKLNIYLPSDVPNINQDFCAVLMDQQKQDTNATLQCDLGNPLLKNKIVKIQIKIDVSKLPTYKDKINIFLQAKTASSEINPVDNEINIPIFFKAVADISITGAPEHEQIPYSEHDKVTHAVTVSHSFFVMNHGPSPVQIIDIELHIPTAIRRKQDWIDFLSFTSLEADSGRPLTIPAKCNDSLIKLKPVELDVKKNKDVFGEDDLVVQGKGNKAAMKEEEIVDTNITTTSATTISRSKKSLKTDNAPQVKRRKNLILDCNVASCTVIKCSASPFLDNRKFARITVSAEVNMTILNENLDPWYHIEFITNGKVFLRDAKKVVQPKHHHSDVTSVKTVLIHSGPPPSQEVEKWIIFASIGIGILLLIIILVALIKIGFFKRQQKEKMQKMMMQADLKEWDPIVNDETDVSEKENLHT